MNGEPRPELRAVADPPAEGAAAAPGPRPHPAPRKDAHRRGSWWIVALLVVALLVLFLGYLSQRERAESLAGEVQALETRLQDAEQSLRAAEARMERVRGHVDALADRFALLQREVGGGAAATAEPEARDPGAE